MTILFTAFILGLMGSLHCIGMCGPIALSLPLRGKTVWQKIWGSTLWSIGRIITYSIMGALFGVIGSGLKILGYQQVISIIVGILMILSVFLPALFKNYNFGSLSFIFSPIRRGMQRLFQEKNNRALFLLGIFNGLLPCGLVYMAIAGAIGDSRILLINILHGAFRFRNTPFANFDFSCREYCQSDGPKANQQVRTGCSYSYRPDFYP